MIWFTSDTHFGHGRIVAYCGRPWWREATEEDLSNAHLSKVARPKWDSPIRVLGKAASWEVPDVAAMDEALVAGWNARVRRGDVVFHLGDFAWWRLPADEVARIRARLAGTIVIVYGNHDQDRRTGEVSAGLRATGFTVAENPGDPRVEYNHAVVAIDGVRIFLCHYGPHAWGNRRRPDCLRDVDLYLHGHSHAHGGRVVRTVDRGDGVEIPAVDVSVEGWDYAPVSLREILEKRIDGK
jgi:calcineurin-like phosphoesterase family protein